tara:strand:+ start:361 stop:1209 length:849 start_codon:yes stop_codon:yes gene_type:complete
MEMIDVLQKLKEIAESKPELVKDAVENVEKTNPKVDESRMKDYLHGEAEKLSREEFLKKHGESLRGFYNAINGSEDDEDDRPDSMESKHMKKETVKEDIKISADTPQEASMMMQILKLAGVQPVDAKMIGADEPEHGSDMDPGAMNKQMDTPSDDDAMGSQEMGRMRDMMTAPAEEKAAETFANEPEEKVQDVDSLVNVHSGGLNRQKKTYPRVSPGDNPMTAEDKITEQDIANSLRDQYDAFKESYKKAAETKAKPDFLDMDKDGNKKEPMKKAIKDKEAK